VPAALFDVARLIARPVPPLQRETPEVAGDLAVAFRRESAAV
jgi:hypothetical protein